MSPLDAKRRAEIRERCELPAWEIVDKGIVSQVREDCADLLAALEAAEKHRDILLKAWEEFGKRLDEDIVGAASEINDCVEDLEPGQFLAHFDSLADKLVGWARDDEREYVDEAEKRAEVAEKEIEEAHKLLNLAAVEHSGLTLQQRIERMSDSMTKTHQLCVKYVGERNAAEKRIAELEVALKSISDLQPDDEYINLDSSSANYDDCYRDGWYDGERNAAIMARAVLGGTP
ncbi:MAG: hypothetical protein KGL39_05705 [Patescibacteria group bacterium]|nr:hypothetical protein [Patescibacteria group bacterium]